MWKKLRPDQYLIPGAVFVPEATRIPENVAYVPEGKGKQVYARKEFPFPVEVRDLNWNGRDMRVVVEKRNRPNRMIDLIGTLFGGGADCFECPYEKGGGDYRGFSILDLLKRLDI